MTRLLEAVRKLSAVTEQQIEAARHLRSEELASLNQRRVDALFDLRIVLAEEGCPERDRLDPRAPLRDAVRQLDVAEKRLASLAQTVLDRLAWVDDSNAAAPVYDRAGFLP